MDADLNAYLTEIEDAEQMQIDAERAFNLLDNDQKIQILTEWNSFLEIAEATEFLFSQKLTDLDPDYLEYLAEFEDFEAVLTLQRQTINDDDLFAGSLQDHFEGQIIEKFKNGEL